MQDDIRLFRPAHAALATLLVFQALCTGLPAAPALTATKDDGLGALVKKPAGSTVTYTNTISNGTGAGITDATGVQFADPDVANTTYVPNTLAATPVAVDDTYPSTVIANSSINTATSGFSVVTNDFAGYSAGTAVLASALTISNVVTPSHGTLVMTLSGAGVGQFVYTPTAGYTGADSFTYTISNSVAGGTAASRTATVNLTVGGPVIWFVDPNLGSNGTGILGNPFNNLAAAVTAIGANINHRVFIYSGGAAQTTGITLNSGAWLVGQAAVGASFEALMGGISYPSDTTAARPSINNGTKPSLTRSAGNTVVLAQNNTILGLAITNSGGGFGISGTAINAVTIGNDVSLSSSSTSSGALSLTGGGNGSLSIGIPISSTGGRSINIGGRTGGTVTFSGAIGDTGTGISLTGNTGATIAFTGGLSLSTGANTAFSATGGGTVTATQNNTTIVNTITTTIATALNVSNTTIGASGLTFRSINSNGGTSNGLILDTTGSSGGLAVVGDGGNTSLGGNSSGGTIQNKNGADGINTNGVGIYLNNTAGVVLRRMTLGGTIQNFGIRGFGVNGFTMEYCTVGGTLGTNNSGIGEGGVYFGDPLGATGVTGTGVVTSCNISGGRTDNFSVHNTSGTLNRMTVTNSTFGLNQAGANDSLAFEARNLGTVLNATVTGCTFTGAPGDLASFVGQIDAAMDVVFQNNICSNNHAGNIIGGGGLTFAGFTATTINASNNSLRDANGSAITLQLGAPVAGLTTATSFSGSVNNNTIGVTGVADSGSKTGNGIFFSFADNSTLPKGQVNLAITNNIIRRCSGNAGIYADNTGGNYDFKLTCTGNTVAEPGAGAFAGFAMAAGSPTSTDDIDIFAKITGNDFSTGDPSNANDIIVGVSTGVSSLKLAGTAGPADGVAFASLAAVQTFLLNNNNVAGTVVAAYTDSPATAANFLGAGATSPPLPSTLLFASGGIEAQPVAASVEPVSVTAQADVGPSVATPTPLVENAVQQPGGISQADLDAVVSSATARWEASGLTDVQLQTLRNLQFEVTALADSHLGEAGGNLIRVDGNASGNGWFVDASGASDSLFGNVKSDTRRYTDGTGLPAGRLDLLTTIMHEMGHALGLPDSYSSQDRESIMFGQLTKGERRTPARNQASGAKPFAGDATHFLSGGLNPITIGILPPGKSVVITYDVLIDNPFALGATQLTSQGTVHSTTASFTDTLTDDPTVGGASDPTVTLLDRPDTTVASIVRATSSPTNTSSVSWTVTFANAISGLTGSNFLLLSSGLGGTPAISSVTPTGGAPATVWTVTASTGSGNGTLGLNLANDTALSHDVTNQPFTGQVYTIDRTAPNASIILADTALKAGETSGVTITFSEAVNGFTNADLTAPNGTLSPVATGDNITWTATFTPTAGITAATNLITLNNTGVSDTAGNTGTGSTDSNNYAIDTARPTATIVVADNNLTIGETSLVTITFSEAVTGFTNADLTIANGTLSAVSSGDGGITWTATLTPTPNVTDATNLITLDNTGVTDPAGNTGTGTTDSNNYAVTSLSISIAANAPSIAEGTGAGTTAFTFTVSRTGSTAGAVTMNFAVSGTANATDFGGTLPSGIFTIPDTQASATLTVNVSHDSTVEPDEAFTVTLSSASGGYVISTAAASSTITNDDFAADLAITVTDGVTTATPGASVTYTIVASNAGPDPVTGATIADTFPASLTATWTAAGAGGATAPASGSGNINALVNLPVGGSVTFTVSATISPAATGTLSNTATISSSVTDPTPGNNSATDNDTLAPQADLAITKTDGVTTVTPGGNLTYTITASNAGPSNVVGATLADTFPASLTATWTAVGAGGGTAPASGSGNINASVNLPAGGSVTFTVSATISAAATGTLSNTATITAPAGVTDPTPGNNSATDTDTLAPQADLTITKTDGVTTAVPGNSVTYTITASNSGPSNAPGATVADTFPASLTATWTAVGAGGGTAPASGSGNINASVNLPAGGSVTFTVTATISASATGTLSNTATVTALAGVTDPTPGNNSATDTDTLTPQANLAITKTDGVTTAVPGSSVTYTITASNAGPSSVTGATVADTLPASISGATWTAVGAGGGTATASGSGNISDTVNLPVGASVTYTVTAPISATATGTLSNTVTVSSAVADPTPGNNSATDSDTLAPQADLTITKTDGVTTAVPGTSVTYTITASNAGPSSVTGVTVADTLPGVISGATWTAIGAGGGTGPASGSGNISASNINLPAGASFTFTVTAPISAAATGTLSNTATVSSAVTDPTPGNNSATDTDTLTPQADLAVTKTDGVTTAVPGTSVTYTITASNAGPSNVIGGTVADTLPAIISGATWTAVGAGGGTATASGSGNINDTVNLPAGGSVTYTVTAPISDSATGTLSNTATINSAVTDLTPGNNSATDTDTLTPQSDLAVTITDSPDPVNAVGFLTYTITLTNNGPSTADSGLINLPIPANTTLFSSTAPGGWGTSSPGIGGTGTLSFTKGSFAPGTTATFQAVVRVNLEVVDNTTLTATVTAPAHLFLRDPNTANNSATTTTLARNAADLQISLADAPDPVVAGNELTYTIQVANNGPVFAQNVSISDALPAGTTFVSLDLPSFWSATTPVVGANGTVTITNPFLANAATATFTLRVKVGAGVPNGFIVSNTAVVASTTLDIVPGNNSATTTTLAKSGADLQITLADSSDPVIAGTNLTYTLQVANNGPLDADNVNITDTLPAGTTFVSLTTPAGWTSATPAVGATGVVTITKPLFVNSGSGTFTLVVKVAPGVANGMILGDTAAVTSTTLDIIPGNNSATTTSTVTTQSDLAIQITGTPSTAPKSSNVTYVMTLTNNGPSDASAPNVSLPLPSQMTFVSATAAAGWSTTTPAVGANGTVNFSAAALASGATVNFTVVAKVKSTAPTGAILTTIVTASAAGVEPVPANNVAASIASVGTVKPTAVQPVTTGFVVNPQTGLFDINVKVTNTTPLPINGFRLRVNFDAYKAAYPSLRLENATSTSKKTNVYIDYPNAVAVNATVTLKLSFYTSTRTFPSPFAPVLTVDLLASSVATRIIGGGVQPSLAKLADQTVQLTIPAAAGRWYRVRYSSDLVSWTACPVPVMATADSLLWIDCGPPYTVSAPAITPNRFYLVDEIEAP